jgi:hypothetical protein
MNLRGVAIVQGQEGLLIALDHTLDQASLINS